MSRTNEARHAKWHKPYKCKCRLDASFCNNKQRCNDDKCQCECKKLIDKGVCDKGFIWNPSNCEWESDKSCNFGKYLDYENCISRRKLVDKLVEEGTENIDEVKIASENEHRNKCSSYILCCFRYVLRLTFELLLILFILIGTEKKMLLVLSLILVLKQQFIELINGRTQKNKNPKSNLLFLQRHD